jgi:hypothetical protein
MDEKFLGSYRLDALVPETHRRWLERYRGDSKSVTVRQSSQDWAGREQVETREVLVPPEIWNKEGLTVMDVLQAVFYWGQNEAQPVSDRCSVSVDDLIEFGGELWSVENVGFERVKVGPHLSPLIHFPLQSENETE